MAIAEAPVAFDAAEFEFSEDWAGVVNVGVIFVTYHPSDDFADKVLRILRHHQDLKLCVVDNSPETPASLESLEQNGITIISNFNNGGIAGAFNRGVKHLRRYRCDGYVTFDQDSGIPDDFFTKLCQFIEKRPGVNLVCPDFIDINSKTSAKFVKLNRWTYKVTEGDTVHFAISSGFYFSDGAYAAIGDFNDDLFIDHVDTEYCLRALQCGYQIHVNRSSVLRHSIGNRSVRKLFGLTIKPNNHSPLRRYYIARNGVYLSRQYFKSYPSFSVLNLFRSIHELLAIVFFEDTKIRKLKAFAWGCIDGIRGNLGVCRRKL